MSASCQNKVLKNCFPFGKQFFMSFLSGHNLNRDIEHLGYLYDCVNMTSGCLGKMMRRPGEAPAVDEFSRTAAKFDTVVGISDGEHLAVYILGFRCDKLEVAVPILRNGKISDRPKPRIELGKISAARLPVEYLDDLHRRLLSGNSEIT